MRKYLVFFLLFLASWQLQAQFVQAEVSVNGLTCSQCSRSVELALKRLPFVESVAMNLQEPKAVVVFKKNTGINFFNLAKAVQDAGFSVRSIKAKFLPSKNDWTETSCFNSNGTLYYRKGIDNVANKNYNVLLLGKGLISKTELDKYKHKVQEEREASCDTKSKVEIPYLLLN